MAMLYAAAQGETKAQIQHTFHYPKPAILNPNSAALYNQFNKPNPNYDLSTVNDLWMSQESTPNQAYLDTVRRYYGGQVTNLDFGHNPESARQTINQTIANHTQQMIPKLLSEGTIRPDTASVLTNAVYFKSEWAKPLTLIDEPKPFTNADGTAVTTSMMFEQANFNYMEDDEIQLVELPYKNNHLSMLILLPKSDEPSAMQTLIANLDNTKINNWTQKLKNENLFLMIPKFRLEEAYEMENTLSQMGMPTVFTQQADFGLLDENRPLKVDSIIHKAVIEVDEKGTVAAAATSMGIVVVSAPPVNAQFIADHPFVFVIKDNTTEALLFLGQVNTL